MPTTIPAENTGLANLNGPAYVSLGTGLGLNMLGTAPYSFECWVYPYAANSTGTIFSQAGEYVLSLNGGRIQSMRTNQLGPLTGTSVLPANTWSYVAVTFDGYNLSVYYNGNLEANQTAFDAGIAPQGGDAQLGANNGQSVLSCDVELFRAWRICLTQADLNLFAYDTPVAPQGAFYTYIDFSQIPAVDRSGLGIPVSYQGGAVQQITAPGLLLNGTTQYAAPTNIAKLVAGGAAPYTVEGWIYLSTTAGQQAVYSSQDAQGNQTVLFYVDGGYLKSQRGSVGTLVSTTQLQVNQWYDVATTYDGVNLTIYINGQQDCTSAVAALPAGTTGAAQVGASQVGTTYSMFLNGWVQFLTFWNLALTQDQLIGILYEDPTHYPGIGANFDFSNSLSAAMYNNPAVDLTNGAPLTLGPTAAPPSIQVLRTTVTSQAQARAVTPTRAHSRLVAARRPDTSGVGAGKPLACASDSRDSGAKPVVPLSQEHRALLFEEFDSRYLTGLRPELQESLRAQYMATVNDTFDRLTDDPDSVPRLRFHSRREGDEHVLTFHFPDGTVFQSRVSALEFTNCQIWWGGFLFTLFYGFLSIYFRVPKEQLLNAIWVALRNQATALAFEAAVAAGVITFQTIISITQALYNTGLLKTVLWMIASSLGWWGFTKFLLTIVGQFVPVPTPTKAYAAIMCVTTVAQMALQFVGSTTPPVPGYHQSCG